jgi:hypothetical protein
MWHWLKVKLERLSDFLFTHEVIDFFSQPFGMIIILVVIIAFAYFALRLPK